MDAWSIRVREMLWRSRSAGALASLAFVLAACSGSHREQHDYDLGHVATSAELAAVATPIVDSDGSGLPPGRGSVAQGEALYETRCGNCHDVPAFPQLWGGIGSLKKFPQKTVGSFWPYAPTIYDYIARAMPPNARVPLTPSETYALTAYVLYRNDLVPHGATLDARALPAVKMPNRDGFFSDDGKPDT